VYVSADDVYLELRERAIPGLEDGSDAAAINGLLAGLGDPATAPLAEGWTLVSQGRTEFGGRIAAERVFDIQTQVRRHDRIVRAGPTFVHFVTMSRHDQLERNAPIIECFERAIRFAAPANP
jgi:hypothetical protein